MITNSAPTSTALPSPIERYAQRKTGGGQLDDRLVTCLQDAHERGRRRARDLERTHATSNPVTLARAADIDVVSDRWAGMETFTILGSYADGTITVYERQVRETAASLPLSAETVWDVVVAHELGHGVLDDAFAPDNGPLKRLRGVVAEARGDRPRRERTVLVETAAHAFAGTLVDVVPLTHPIEVTERPTITGREDCA